MTIENRKLLVRIDDAAKLLSMSPRKLWGLAISGEVPSFKQGQSRFFAVCKLEEWIEEKTELNGGAN